MTTVSLNRLIRETYQTVETRMIQETYTGQLKQGWYTENLYWTIETRMIQETYTGQLKQGWYRKPIPDSWNKGDTGNLYRTVETRVIQETYTWQLKQGWYRKHIKKFLCRWKQCLIKCSKRKRQIKPRTHERKYLLKGL